MVKNPPLTKKNPAQPKQSNRKATNSNNKKSRANLKKSLSNPNNDSEGSGIEIRDADEVVDADVE